MNHNSNECPVCRNELKENCIWSEDHENIHHINCQFCGKYKLSGRRINYLYGLPKTMTKSRKTPNPILSMAIRKKYEETKEEVIVDHNNVKELEESVKEPESPLDKIDLLLLYLRKRNRDNSKDFVIPIYDYPLIYARNVKELDKVLQLSEESGLLKLKNSDIKSLKRCEITLKGWEKYKYLKTQAESQQEKDSSRQLKCFIVHGQNNNRRQKLKDFLISINITPIILDEQLNRGKTITEKIEFYAAHVDFAICLWTRDDEGRRRRKNSKMRDRVRQNVMLETGYFWGKLSRKNFIILYCHDLEMPSDLHGVVYVAWDQGRWKDSLKKEIENMRI